MPYQISYREAAKNEVKNLPGHIHQRVRRAIADLAGNPKPAGTKELRELPGFYRLRLDKWRIIYEIDEQYQLITIVSVRRKTGPETYLGLD